MFDEYHTSTNQIKRSKIIINYENIYWILKKTLIFE